MTRRTTHVRLQRIPPGCGRNDGCCQDTVQIEGADQRQVIACRALLFASTSMTQWIVSTALDGDQAKISRRMPARPWPSKDEHRVHRAGGGRPPQSGIPSRFAFMSGRFRPVLSRLALCNRFEGRHPDDTSLHAARLLKTGQRKAQRSPETDSFRRAD